MKTISLSLLAVFVFVGSASADSYRREIQCRSAKNDFQYSYSIRWSGVPPRPGTPMSIQEFTYQGQKMQSGTLGAETVIKEETENSAKIAVAVLTIQTNAGPVQDVVICEYDRFRGAPPP